MDVNSGLRDFRGNVNEARWSWTFGDMALSQMCLDRVVFRESPDVSFSLSAQAIQKNDRTGTYSKKIIVQTPSL